MTQDECFHLGYITKPFGVRGQVVFFLDVDDPSQYAGLDTVLVEVKGSLVPYFFQIDSLSGNKAVVTFDEMEADEARALVGSELYLPLTMLPPLTGNRFYFHEIIGFHIVDQEYGDIGTVKSVLENPAQPIFQIDCNGTEILIPVIDPVIRHVDRENKEIQIQAPAGLIALYLGEPSNGDVTA
ncbi:MAG: 16S rRNA processing protein RimM [bacterium P3]|nr:MAG: 16S rRNA processing protein RimM [bacterium P3]KWW42297.1 MAG: 16S rRNA processing protein RimM [bacterium F083]